MDLDISELLRVYAMRIIGDWFDFVLHEVWCPLMGHSMEMEMEMSWRINLLEVEYDSSVEKSFSALF